tara:strand:+ start:265 stop:1275 length:1011 start_codon:yes stop_codon:yes gene_type:complete
VIVVTFYLNNTIINDFTQIWTNRILFEKILEKNLEYKCDIFLIQPTYKNDSPFEIIKSMDKTKKIILWYMDTLPEEFYGSHQSKIEELCKLEYDVSVIIPDFHLNGYDLSCEVFNNYSMADCILEQQKIDHKNIMEMRAQSESIYREKYFLSYNGNLKKHRMDLVSHIKENDIMDKFDISFNSFFWNNNKESMHLDLKEKSYYTSTKLNLPLYFNSYFDVVTFSKYETNDVYIDEKLYRSFACFKPFIIIAQPHTLKILRGWGFETFEKFIDESYDNEKDNDKRIKMVFDEIDKISKMRVDEVDTLYNRMKSVLDHNYTHLQRYIRKVDSQILEIF